MSEKPSKESWCGIPGRWIDDSTAVDGRRFIATDYGWTLIKQRLRTLANNSCEECNAPTYYGDPHHVYGRGFGGGKRDDRIEVDGVRLLLWLCRNCHSDVKILPWGSWNVPAI